MSNPLEFFAAPGPMTDPGPHAVLFADLPADIPSLVKIVQNNLVHIFWAERYGLKLTEEQQYPVTVRDVATKLALIRSVDDRALVEPRPVEKRLVSNCRDFSVVLTSILRYQGVPARARCGFGAYFIPNHLEDHWVVEYWKAAQGRWVMVDAQLDRLMIDALGIQFDTLDMPPGQFLPAGKAWQMCRAGEFNWDDCGIFDMHGLWFVRGNLVRDLLSLNKVEILPWDGGWGVLSQLDHEATETGVQYELFDRLASLTLCGDEALSELRDIYENTPGFKVPEELQIPGFSEKPGI